MSCLLVLPAAAACCIHHAENIHMPLLSSTLDHCYRRTVLNAVWQCMRCMCESDDGLPTMQRCNVAVNHQCTYIAYGCCEACCCKHITQQSQPSSCLPLVFLRGHVGCAGCAYLACLSGFHVVRFRLKLCCAACCSHVSMPNMQYAMTTRKTCNTQSDFFSPTCNTLQQCYCFFIWLCHLQQQASTSVMLDDR